MKLLLLFFKLANQVIEQQNNLVNTAAPTQVSTATRSEPTELIKYVLMPPQKVRTLAAETNFSAESFAKEIHAAWKEGIFNDTEKLEMVDDSV